MLAWTRAGQRGTDMACVGGKKVRMVRVGKKESCGEYR
jgi:hypothetical protein